MFCVTDKAPPHSGRGLASLSSEGWQEDGAAGGVCPHLTFREAGGFESVLYLTETSADHC